MSGRSRKPKMLLIGIDGADYWITRWLMKQGCLPNLTALARRGAWGPMRSTVPPVTPPAWTTIMTGKNPGKHGVFDFLSMNEGEIAVPVAARRCATTMFRALSDVGYRVGTFNLPVTYPPEPLSGFQVAGLSAPCFGPAAAWPQGAYELLTETGEDFELLLEHPPADANQRAALRRRAELVTLGTRVLLRAFQCDVCMVNFQVTDWAQHNALAAEMRPAQPESLALDGVVAETYRHVDEQVGAILEEWASPQTYIMVVSDHGGAVVDRVVNLEKVFLDSGLLAYKPVNAADKERVERERAVASRVLRVWRAYKRFMPTFARLLRPVAERLRPGLSSYQERLTVDWSRTRAAPWGVYGQIRLNVAGRDPEGVVSPEEVPRLKREIESLLMSITDPFTGRPVYRGVLDVSEIYSGPHATEGPDLVALACEDRYLTVCGRMFGTRMTALIDAWDQVVIEVEPSCDFHSYLGIFFMAGASVQEGCFLREHWLRDFAPTALYLLGEAVPSDMDGQPIVEAVCAETRKQRPVQYADPWPEPIRRREVDYSEEEKALLQDRLRGLGYL